jgi:hypothetical protein
MPFSSRRSTGNPSASACRIVLLNAIQAKLDAFQFSPHHTRNPSASVDEVLLLVSDAEKLPDSEEFRAKQGQAGVCRFSAPHAKPKRFDFWYSLSECQATPRSAAFRSRLRAPSARATIAG